MKIIKIRYIEDKKKYEIIYEEDYLLIKKFLKQKEFIEFIKTYKPKGD